LSFKYKKEKSYLYISSCGLVHFLYQPRLVLQRAGEFGNGFEIDVSRAGYDGTFAQTLRLAEE